MAQTSIPMTGEDVLLDDPGGDTFLGDHGQLFSRLHDNPNGPEDHEEEFSDDGFPHRLDQSGPAGQENDDTVGVGVSMGRAQTKMKSLQTPAVEKKRVLKEHDLQEAEPGRLPRSSTSKSMLASFSSTRQRSSSGTMLTGFKKVLPSINTFKAIPSPFASARSDHASAQRENNLTASPTGHQQLSRKESRLGGGGGSTESLLRPGSPVSTRSRHRANSDSSLYLTKKATSISSYDDIDAFASVSEMTNSRLKAITDSFQNSSLRLPKLPSVIPSDIVILGGYRGSVLRDAKPPHRQLWAPIKLGLNLRSVDLELGLSREDEERAREKVIPSGILSHIGPIDICRRLLKQMRKCPNAREGKLRVHDWGYDWRLSPDLLSQQLIDFLQGRRGAIVIAHSLGGLITRHAVNQRPDLFAGVLYAGSPQHCVNILGPLRNGDDVLLSSRVLTAQVNFTLRTSFALLPEVGRCFFQRDTHERYDLDFFDPKTWEEYRLSPCINPPLAPVPHHHQPRWQHHRKSIIDSMGSLSESMTAALPSLPSVGRRGSCNKDKVINLVLLLLIPTATLTPYYSHSHHHNHHHNRYYYNQHHHHPLLLLLLIARHKLLAFKRALAHREALQAANQYPPHAILFGKTVPTVYGVRVASREAILHSDAFDDLAFAAGDGVVLASAAQLPPGYRCVRDGRVESDRGHVGLLGDLEAVGRCLAALVHARHRGVGEGNFE
ncbi:hypothetical protein DV735_g2107, partial [Chaetothyriales sp. CBS 134920]